MSTPQTVNPDAEPAPLYTKLKPAELEALEELFRVEVASAMESRPVLPDPAKTPAAAMRVLAAMGLVTAETVSLPPPPGDRLRIPTQVSVYFLTHAGRMEYGNYADTFDYDDGGNVIGPKKQTEEPAANA